MKKKELADRLERFAEVHLTSESHAVRVAKDRYEQAERLFKRSEDLLRSATNACRVLEEKVIRGKRIEADSIDEAQMREALRFVAMAIGIEETSPGRYVGGYEAILHRVRELLDAEEKAYLLTGFYNAAIDVCRPSKHPGVLMARSDVFTVRRCIQAVADDPTTQPALRESLLIRLRTSRSVIEATEKAMTEGVSATVAGVVGRR